MKFNYKEDHPFETRKNEGEKIDQKLSGAVGRDVGRGNAKSYTSSSGISDSRKDVGRVTNGTTVSKTKKENDADALRLE